MTYHLHELEIALGMALTLVGCSGSDGKPNDNAGGAGAGAGATAGTGGAATGGSAGTSTGTGGSDVIVQTPEGTLFTDDFESGAANWDVTQGTCSIGADGTTNVYTCVNGGNEARAVAGDPGWGEYSVQARVRVNAMDPSRRIYLAARFTDSNNWYGAGIYNSSPIEVQIRKKVAGSSSDIARTPYPITFGEWYTLKFEVKGSTLRLYVDDVLQIETTDTEFASGRIALLVDRSDVSWDDVLVTNP